MKTPDSNLDELYQDLAKRFGALGRFFGQLDTPKAARELLDSLVAEDAKGFNGILDRAEISLPLGKCFWIREIIERIVVTPLGFVEECWLRDDLTPAERLLYLRIAIRHGQLDRIGKSKQITFEEKTGRYIIPTGAFLDELRANGLVVCTLRMTYDTSLQAVLGPPERVCV